MTASSAPLPQRRREALLQQLNDARARADQREIARVEQQWVHRYGVSSLPQFDTQSDTEFDKEFDTKPAPELDVPSVEAVAPASVLDRFKSALQGCLDEVGSTVEPAVSAIDRAPLPPSEDVPPPPSPKLHRLRRWLPTVVDDLPQAS